MLNFDRHIRPQAALLFTDLGQVQQRSGWEPVGQDCALINLHPPKEVRTGVTPWEDTFRTPLLF